ncbi:hypothetical protein HK098_003938 [Nowakowskiella sp. JEL0407]|nr:hypothetical protein HK098_003938 [Nowakowskiella sp. JEL0407]
MASPTTPTRNRNNKPPTEFIKAVYRQKNRNSSLLDEEDETVKTWRAIIQEANNQPLNFNRVALPSGSNSASPVPFHDQSYLEDFKKLNAILRQKTQERDKALRDKNDKMQKDIEYSIANLKQLQEERERKYRLEQERIQKEQERIRLEEERRRIQEEEAKRIREAEAQRLREEAERRRIEEEQRAARAQADERRRCEEQEQRENRDREGREELERLARVRNSNVDEANADVPLKAWESWQRLSAKLKDYRENIKPYFVNNPEKKLWLWKKKMELTKRVGQLTEVHEKILSTIQVLRLILTQAEEIGQKEYEGVLKKLSKAIVRQAEKEIAVKPSMSSPWATVIVILLVHHKLTFEYIIGSMMERCNYLIPMYINKLPSQTQESYYKQLKYRTVRIPCTHNPPEEDCDHPDCVDFEEERQYQERMVGLISLFAAITGIELKREIMSIDCSWMWLAQVVNMKIIGDKLIDNYGDQAWKLIRLIPKLFEDPETDGPAKMRLLLMLEEDRFNEQKWKSGEYEAP